MAEEPIQTQPSPSLFSNTQHAIINSPMFALGMFSGVVFVRKWPLFYDSFMLYFVGICKSFIVFNVILAVGF